MLVGLNWDHIWVPAAGAAALILLHILLKLVRGRPQ